MTTRAAADLVRQFNANWTSRRRALALVFDGDELANLEGHPLEMELRALLTGQSATLPFLASSNQAKWCTVAPDINRLRSEMKELQTWLLPSYGWLAPGDGYVSPEPVPGGMASAIIALSPAGYFRWSSAPERLEIIAERLAQRRRLNASRPPRSRPVRASLYELRSRFSTALLAGDRDAANAVVEEIDLYQLDSALNVHSMRIRLWHHFREFHRIAGYPDLSRLRSQLLPASVEQWIEEALQATGRGTPAPSPAPEAPVVQESPAADWEEWFSRLASSNPHEAGAFLSQRPAQSAATLTPPRIRRLVEQLEQTFLDETLLAQRRELLQEALAELLQDYVREPDFPRPNLGDLYLAILRLWATLFAGSSIGGAPNVLLELSSAVLRLNREPAEVSRLIHAWWEARRVPAQLPFLLDAIELLDREHPDRNASASLWIEAADFIRRSAETLTNSEKTLWRAIGTRLGIDRASIADYLPEDAEVTAARDTLEAAGLRKIAIVCMRERQASDASAAIKARTGAEVVLVSGKTPGEAVTNATSADVVLFVWMATSHSVFRAFDGFDRKRFCYVQGTGSASIVRALERWVHERG